MDLPAAVKNYQFGERAKSELIMVSQLCVALTGFKDQEKVGARRMLIMVMEATRAELQFAVHSTGHSSFQKAINSLSEAISLVESDHPDEAALRIGAAVSAATTPAQEAWQVLSEHGLL